MCHLVWPCVALCSLMSPYVTLCRRVALRRRVWFCVAVCSFVSPCVCLCHLVCNYSCRFSFKNALKVNGWKAHQFREALSVYRQGKPVEKFLDLLELGRLHCPTGGAHNTFPKTRMLRKLFQFYQFKCNQWDAQGRYSDEENQHVAATAVFAAGNEWDAPDHNSQPVVQPSIQPPVPGLTDNQPDMVQQQVRSTQTDPTESGVATVEPQGPLGTRSVSWCNGFMDGLVSLTCPLLFSLAHNMDRDKVKEMAQRFLSYPDVVTLCSRLVELYLKGNPKTLQLNKYYGMSVCHLMLSHVCLLVSPHVIACHHQASYLRLAPPPNKKAK